MLRQIPIIILIHPMVGVEAFTDALSCGWGPLVQASSLEGTLRARDEEARRLRDELERARQEVRWACWAMLWASRLC